MEGHDRGLRTRLLIPTASAPHPPQGEAGGGLFWGLIFWMENGAERRPAHRVLYEAIRRLSGQAWFEETEGDAAYLQMWCRGIIQDPLTAP